jgi:predicted TIM-barrel fold metal-dependent hydrolase
MAEKTKTPVFVLAPGRLDLLLPYLSAFPGLQFILDHCGISFPLGEIEVPDRYSRFDQVLELSEASNLALKWAHVERWSKTGYPFTDMTSQLRRAIDAFGADRIMWASDYTQMRIPELTPHRCSWAGALHYILDSNSLSDEEKEWILGGTVRKVLGWHP